MKRFALLFTLVFALVFAGCQDDDEAVVTEVEFAKASMEARVGEIISPEILYTPANLPAPVYNWSSSDEKVVRVLENGQLKAVSAGTATVQISADNNRLSAVCQLVVSPVNVTGVTLSQESMDLIVGESAELLYEFEPDTATNPVFLWSSDNPQVAKVEEGTITALVPGSASVTVSARDGEVSAVCKVVVNAMPVSGVSLNEEQITVKIDSSFQLIASILPKNATNKNLTWSVADSEIAEVDASGIVTGITPGLTTVSVETEDGGFSSSCEVKVPTLAEMYDLKEVGKGYVADDGLTVTMISIVKSVTDSYTTYEITYLLKNDTDDKKIDENTFKLVSLTGAEAEDQYGYFGSLFPGESKARSYTFKVLNSLEYHIIEYNGEFFSDTLREGTLKWDVSNL